MGEGLGFPAEESQMAKALSHQRSAISSQEASLVGGGKPRCQGKISNNIKTPNRNTQDNLEPGAWVLAFGV